MESKRILVVYDDKNIIHLLEHTLTKLGENYRVVTSMDSTEALEMVRQQRFDLVVADYMMPGITGVDLATAIRRLSPETQVILMTAYGTSRLRSTTKLVGIDGFVDKPFSVDEIHAVIQKTVQLAAKPENAGMVEADDASAEEVLRSHLEVLQVNTNARSVLLLDTQGEAVQTVGRSAGPEIASIGRFVAKNFVAATELAETMQSRSVFKSSYYEGDDYNLYACHVNRQLYLAVVFESRQKPGVVWFYTKQTASTLAEILRRDSSD